MYVFSMQEATGTFEQFVSTLRKERRKADEQFIQETIKRFNELKVVIEQVQHAAQQILIKHNS
jgi:two-component system sensor histidine kinase BarA